MLAQKQQAIHLAAASRHEQDPAGLPQVLKDRQGLAERVPRAPKPALAGTLAGECLDRFPRALGYCQRFKRQLGAFSRAVHDVLPRQVEQPFG